MKNFTISLTSLQFVSLTIHGQHVMAPMQAPLEQAAVTLVIMWGMPPQQPALTIHFFGAYSGRSTTRGDGNTAAGIHALYYNAGGDSNI